MKKVYPDAKAALAGLLKDGMLDHGRRLRPVRHPGNPDSGHPRIRREKPDRRLQQCRHRWRRPRPSARHQADQEDDLVLCGGEQDLCAAIPRRRARDRVQPARHAGGAHPRRGRRHPGLLHQDRRRHDDREGQGGTGVRRRALRHGARARRRPLDRARLEGRHRRQSGLPQDRAQLQSDDGHRREE